MKSVAELNAAIRVHKKAHKLTKTESEVLEVLSQYSVKEVGRSWLSKSTIAELVGKSRRTIIRVCNRLESLGIISQRARKRQTGDRRQTSNLIVIQKAEIAPSSNEEPAKVEQTVNVTPECHTKETPIKSLKNNNTYLDTTIPSNALKGAIPEPIYNAMARYFNADSMYKYYGILLRAKASIDRTVMIEDNPEPFIEALNATVYKAKRGRVRNMSNYLFAAFQSATSQVLRRKYANRGVFYDWLDV